MKSTQQSRCMTPLHLLVLDLRQATTTWLSLWQMIWRLAHAPPQAVRARIIGISSFSTMDRAWARLSHCTWNQEWLSHALHPHEPEASDVISSWGRWEGGERKETPFHLVMKVFRHARSEQKPVLRRIIGCEGCTACNKSIIRRRKDLPDLTTLQAWLRRPIRDLTSDDS